MKSDFGVVSAIGLAILALVFTSVSSLLGSMRAHADMNERICTIYAEQQWSLPYYCHADDLTEEAIRKLSDSDYRRLKGATP